MRVVRRRLVTVGALTVAAIVLFSSVALAYGGSTSLKWKIQYARVEGNTYTYAALPVEH